MGGLLTLSQLESRASAQPSGMHALGESMELCRRLRAGDITTLEWHARIAAAMQSSSVEELGRAVDIEGLRARVRGVRRGAVILRVPAARALCSEEGSDVKVFFVRAGRSDPPHCHFNMVAAHIVLEGRFRVRHFDRVREERGGVVLRPTHDSVVGPGEVTSISDTRDNAHWFLAETDGVLLDVQQGRLDPSLAIRRRQMLDIDGATPLADGSILAPHLDRYAALRRYG